MSSRGATLTAVLLLLGGLVFVTLNSGEPPPPRDENTEPPPGSAPAPASPTHLATTPGASGEDRVPTSRDCSDDDPCTIDFFHEVRGACVHTPDPYCSKSCRSNDDCSFPRDMAPCTIGTCTEGACSYLKLSVDECASCSTDEDCDDSFCQPRECRDGHCRSSERVCNDEQKDTWDLCDDDAGRCLHFLADGMRPCQVKDDCRSDHPCQEFTCNDGLCQVRPETRFCGDRLQLPQVCRMGGDNRECIQTGGDVCIAGPCEEGFCSWREVPNSPRCQHCNDDEECEGSFCQWPVCTGTVCVVESVPFCQDRRPETQDLCSEEQKSCLHRWTETPPVCATPAEDDLDSATVDVCDTNSGESLHLPGLSAAGGPEQDACATSNRCYYSYTGPEGYCLGHKLNCRHDNACGASCKPDVGCVFDDAELCPCQNDAECDLGSPCARVVCMGREDGLARGSGGACWGTLIDDCVPCQSNSDCVVDRWCILGECSADGWCRYNDGITCDDGDPQTMGFCHGHKDDSCTYEALPPKR